MGNERATGGSRGSILGEPVPRSDRPGASPETGGGRLLAAASHLAVVVVAVLTAFAAVGIEDTGGKVAASALLAGLVMVVLIALWFSARGLAPEVSHQAAQAAWWLVAVAVVLFAAAIVASVLGSAGYPLFFIAALATAVPSAVAAYRVSTGGGHRYFWVADRMDAGRNPGS